MGAFSKTGRAKKEKYTVSVFFDSQYSFRYGGRINNEKRLFFAKSFSVYVTLYNWVYHFYIVFPDNFLGCTHKKKARHSRKYTPYSSHAI